MAGLSGWAAAHAARCTARFETSTHGTPFAGIGLDTRSRAAASTRSRVDGTCSRLDTRSRLDTCTHAAHLDARRAARGGRPRRAARAAASTCSLLDVRYAARGGIDAAARRGGCTPRRLRVKATDHRDRGTLAPMYAAPRQLRIEVTRIARRGRASAPDSRRVSPPPPQSLASRLTDHRHRTRLPASLTTATEERWQLRAPR